MGQPRSAGARFIYYGASVEFFFTVMVVFTVLTVIGMFRNNFLWGGVRVLEGIGNTIGRIGTAWFGLAMVLQQVIIVFTQRVFRVGEISIGPFGTAFSQDISWWAEELKLYNAMIVCLCVSYTFIQNGHVRVDLFYAGVKSPHQENHRHAGRCVLHAARDCYDLSLWLVLHVAASGAARSLGLFRA